MIELKQSGSNIVLLTKDDGIGFSFDAKEQEHRGLGLRNLQSRSEIMQGRFSAQSGKGKGVQYIFEIPIQTLNGQ
jgi:signal transduction histidine kinase